MGISVKKVGHVVPKVRDLERAVAFYRDVIGLEEVARSCAPPAPTSKTGGTPIPRSGGATPHRSPTPSPSASRRERR